MHPSLFEGVTFLKNFGSANTETAVDEILLASRVYVCEIVNEKATLIRILLKVRLAIRRFYPFSWPRIMRAARTNGNLDTLEVRHLGVRKKVKNLRLLM